MAYCYTYAFCGMCRKENCDKRIKDYIGDMKHVPCNGSCHTCSRAIPHHTIIGKQPYVSMKNLHVCSMYYLQKHHIIEFYGRVGENSDQSLMEKAISQINKCRICTDESIMIPMLEKLSFCEGCSNNQKEVCVENFLAKFDKNKICKNIQEVGDKVLSVISENNGVKINEICEQVHSTNSFFVHEITISLLIEELVNQEKVIVDSLEKYYIK